MNPWDRIDFEIFSKIAKIINPKELSNYCGESFDVFFNTKRKFIGGTPSQRLKLLYEFGGMNFATFPSVHKLDGEEHHKG